MAAEHPHSQCQAVPRLTSPAMLAAYTIIWVLCSGAYGARQCWVSFMSATYAWLLLETASCHLQHELRSQSWFSA